MYVYTYVCMCVYVYMNVCVHMCSVFVCRHPWRPEEDIESVRAAVIVFVRHPVWCWEPLHSLVQ